MYLLSTSFWDYDDGTLPLDAWYEDFLKDIVDGPGDCGRIQFPKIILAPCKNSDLE